MIEIQQSPIPWYGIFFMLSLLLGFSVFYIFAVKSGVKKSYAGYSVLLNFFTVLCIAKAFSVVLSGFQTDIISAGFSSLGGALGLLLGILIFEIICGSKQPEIRESYAKALPLFYAVSKLGCFSVGCCHGIAYTGPLCVRYSTDILHSVLIFPVQLLESVLFFLIFIILCFITKKVKSIVPYSLILCGCAKFFADFLRAEHTGKIISVNQVLCILIAGAGFYFIIKDKKQHG